MAAPPRLTLRLFGAFEVARGEGAAPIALRRSTAAVVAYLAATDRPQPRQDLVDLFCQEARDPLQALRSILSRIRQRLGPECLLADANTVCFNTAASWVDCLVFAQALARGPAAEPVDRLAATVDLYRGGFLAQSQASGTPEFEQWRLSERTRYQRLYALALQALIDKLAAQGELEAAIRRARALVQSDPLQESAQARLVWLYARSGQREAALAQFEQCRQLLARELAVAPARELAELRDAIVAGQVTAALPLRPAPAEVRPAPPAPGDLVGRKDELARLRAAWEAARPGSGSVVGVSAEAGMGKTRLVREFAATLSGADVLVGECYESTRALPYAPWLEVLDGRLEHLGPAALTALSPLAREYVARLSPALARRLRRARRPAAPTGGGELGRLFAAVAELLLELPGGRPLLVFIDDLQWADEASLQLFAFLARRPPPGRVMLVGAWRTEEAMDAPALRTLLADLQRLSLVPVRLPPLPAGAVTELIARLWPALPSGYRPHIGERLLKATGGNPLLMGEILRELVQAGAAEVPAALPVPHSVQELIQRRLSRLSFESRQVIEAAAVFGAPVTLDEVLAASGRGEDEASLALDLAERRGLLRPLAGAGPVRYDFGHDLMRAAVLGTLTPVRRQLLHRRAARLLEQAKAPAATLAHHWRMAGDLAQEGHYAALAGEQAAAVYANPEAIRYLERALELVRDPAARLRLMLKLGETWVLTGAWDKAEALFLAALAQAPADHAAQARFQNALGKLMSRRGRFAEARAWLEQARANWQAAGDLAGLAGSTGTLGIVYWQMDDYDQALAHYQEALEIETRRGDDRGVAVWLGNIGSVFLQRGDPARALNYHGRSLALREALGMKREAAIEMGNIGSIHYQLRDYATALDYHQRALRIRRELDDRPGEATMLGWLGLDAWRLGQAQTAQGYLVSALRADLALGNQEGVGVQLGRLGQVLVDEGEQRAALAWLDRSIALLRAIGAPFHLSASLSMKARALFELGEPAAAQAPQAEALAILAGLGQPVDVETHVLAARLKVALGQAGPAEAAADLQARLEAAEPAWERAALHYELWRLDPAAPAARAAAAAAAALYADLYQVTRDPRDRGRHAELTGQALPALPAPALPDLPPDEAPALDTLLAQVDAALAAWLAQSPG